MANKRKDRHGDDMVFIGLSLLVWLFGPVRWMVQGNPGLSEADLHAHVLAFKEYGLQFVLGVGVFNVMYLSAPYLWSLCQKVYRDVRERCMAWNDSTKAR